MTLRDDIRETISPYKFGGSRLATMLYILSLDDCADESSGNVESPTGWFARFGRKMLYVDSQGFVYAERFATEEESRAHFDRLEFDYERWGEWEERAPSTFHLTMSTDGAAFDDMSTELARILRAIANRIECGEDISQYQTIHDANGNDVGRFALKPNTYN